MAKHNHLIGEYKQVPRYNVTISNILVTMASINSVVPGEYIQLLDQKVDMNKKSSAEQYCAQC